MPLVVYLNKNPLVSVNKNFTIINPNNHTFFEPL